MLANLLLGVFSASLFGSIHCAGMCGPFALLAGSSIHRSAISTGSMRWWTILGYNLGRLLTYLAAGGLAGSLGMFLDWGGRFGGYQQTAAYVTGGVMILAGLVSLLRLLGVPIAHVSPVWLTHWIQSRFRRIQSHSPWIRPFALGMVTTLLPCGWLYVFVLAAAGSANPLTGIVIMLTFWLGSLPILVAIGFGGLWLKRWSQIRWNPKWAISILVIVLGVSITSHRARVGIGNEPMDSPNSLESSLVKIQHVDHATLPCCKNRENLSHDQNQRNSESK